MGYKYSYPIFGSLPEFQTTHLSSSFSKPLCKLVVAIARSNYFAVNLTSHIWLLQPPITTASLPFN